MDFQRWRMAVSEADGENSLRVTQQKKQLKTKSTKTVVSTVLMTAR